MSIFQGNFPKNSTFFRQFKQFDFPGKNCSFTANSGQIILFLFKSHNFRTYFLYMIRYNNISRPVHDPLQPPRPLCPKPGGSRPQSLRIDASVVMNWTRRQLGDPEETSTSGPSHSPRGTDTDIRLGEWWPI